MPPDSFYPDHAYPLTYLHAWVLTPLPTPLAYLRCSFAYRLLIIPSTIYCSIILKDGGDGKTEMDGEYGLAVVSGPTTREAAVGGFNLQ